MLKKSLLLVLISLLYSYARGQNNNDTLRTTDSTLYMINHSSTGMINYTNNSRSYLLNNALKFNIVRKRISVNSSSGWIYGMQQTGLTNNDFTSAVDVSLFKTVQKFYYWGLAIYDKNFSLKINDRLQSGAGIAYNVLTNPKFNMVLSNGILYEYSSLYDTTYSTARNSFRLKYHLMIGKIVSLNGINFLQQSYVSGKDYILKLNNNISFKMKNWVSFTVSTTYNKLNISNTENFICTIGLTFQKTYTHTRN